MLIHIHRYIGNNEKIIALDLVMTEDEYQMFPLTYQYISTSAENI